MPQKKRGNGSVLVRTSPEMLIHEMGHCQQIGEFVDHSLSETSPK
jgi:hypothetical protein